MRMPVYPVHFFSYCDKIFCMQRNEIVSFLKELRNDLRTAFEAFEPEKRFEQTNWPHKTGGGGEMSVLRGDVFEKAAVNFSAVEGPELPLGDAKGPFFATGVSLITHMRNPHAPTAHFNIRYIETADKWWLGGGFDLTPMGFPYEEDREHFHQCAKTALDMFDKGLYPKFAENAKQYFFLPHRQKERGVGGIFFDYFNTGDREKDFQMWKQVGKGFSKALLPILKARVHTPYTEAERETQALFRGHYVEFNLVYDRGTKFGLASQGNTEAILCSLPPTARW